MKYDDLEGYIPDLQDRWEEEKEKDDELWRTLRVGAITITTLLGTLLFILWLLG